MQHLRVAAHALLRAPRFTATATLTLALGIGLSTAVFTVAEALLLRNLPVRDQDGLALLWGETRDGRFSNVPLPLEDIRELERRSQSLLSVAFFAFRGATPTPARSDDRMIPLRSALVSGNYFEVLGSRALLGRALRAEDDVAGASPLAVLSHHAWQQHFGGDSAIVGRSITMVQSGRSHLIVGIMPRGLDYPRGVDVWIPLIAEGSAAGSLDIVSRELDMLARLRTGATAAQARAELTAFFGRTDAPVWQRGVRGVAHHLPSVVLGAARPALLAVTAAAGLLLLITCVNVANLWLVRSLGRVRELVVRAALGASRARLAGQILAESIPLAIAGGIFGVGLAVAVVRAFVVLAPGDLPRLDEIGVNGVALTAALAITAAAALLSGLWPALFASRVDGHDILRSGSRQSSGRRVRTVAETLVVAQVALAVVSLSAAGLVTRSLMRLLDVDLSFEPVQVVVAELTLRQEGFGDAQQARAAVERLLPPLGAIPGVSGVTPVLTAPFVGANGGIDGRVSRPDQSQDEAARNPVVNMEVVTPNYFSTLGIPVLRGRAFTDEDREGAAPVVVVSRSTAGHLWPDTDPIGKRIGPPGREATVVGVVPDTRYRELQTARPSVYFPLAQSRFPVAPMTLLIRSEHSGVDLVPALRRAVTEMHEGLTVTRVSTMDALLDAPRALPRLNAAVLALFGMSAVLLAAIGLFSVIATMVRQRTREIGIRMALGATAGDVRRLVVLRGLGLALLGTAAGMAGVQASRPLLSTVLFEVSPSDTVTLMAVTGLMLGLAAAASLAPARMGSRTDPVGALRSEA